MENLDSIYTELIMEHSMASHNKRKLEHPDKCEMGHNPSCGDEIELEIIIPKLESNIFFSGDYRTKEEIENAIQESKDN